MSNRNKCLEILIKGIVQGVGFRPFVYNLARELHIAGSVSNTSDGVRIIAEGSDVDLFLERIKKEAPPLSRITDIRSGLCDKFGHEEFVITDSSEQGSFTLASPDISVCNACFSELMSISDRRYHYPFINCTNCGPRYSIIESLPYDRNNTTMKAFRMCGQCSSEYDNPADRRFHAQPNACPECGPRVSLAGSEGNDTGHADPVAAAIAYLHQGKILAIKGIGGFHIVCDAKNSDAVRKLRAEKRKNNKPFAMMAPDITVIRKFCIVTEAEEELLLSPQRPVVLLEKKDDIDLPESVAPMNRFLGFMLPYTPLHYLLFYQNSAEGPEFDALVMTSGNISEEPIIISNSDAVCKLSGIVDAFLMHNRDIFMRIDDSVTRIRRRENRISGDRAAESVFIRRARGYVPEPVPLLSEGPDVLGCGADIKNTFTLTRSGYALVSQHMGDMENFETASFFEETLRNLKKVFRASPVAVAHDLHPGYFSSRWAVEYAEKESLEVVPVQHHFAHICSVIAEHGLEGKVIGVAFDGSGYGDDKTIWGGEFVIADATGYKRAAHLKQIPLPGGEQAVREPWRMAVSYIMDAAGKDAPGLLEDAGLTSRFGVKRVEEIIKVSDIRKFSPLSSGAGRLFDAVSSLTGICDLSTFEGEASIALESLVKSGADDEYVSDIHFYDKIEVDFAHTILSVIDDIKRGIDKSIIATKFHNTVATAIVRVVIKLSLMNNIRQIALSGGVFQNLYLFERVSDALIKEGLAVYANEKVPCNDACISLGQAYYLRERIKRNG